MARVLAFDYGLRRIGLAITDETRLIASALESLPNAPGLMDSIAQIVAAYNVDAFLLGKPVHDGQNSFVPQVLNFAGGLHRRFGFPIYLQDESLSSKSSRAFLISTGKRGKKLKDKLDSAAAQQILSEFLSALEQNRAELYIPEA